MSERQRLIIEGDRTLCCASTHELEPSPLNNSLILRLFSVKVIHKQILFAFILIALLLGPNGIKNTFILVVSLGLDVKCTFPIFHTHTAQTIYHHIISVLHFSLNTFSLYICFVLTI